MTQSWRVLATAFGIGSHLFFSHAQGSAVRSVQYSQEATGVRYEGLTRSEQEAWGPYGLGFTTDGRALTFDAVKNKYINLNFDGKVQQDPVHGLSRVNQLAAFSEVAKLATYKLQPMVSKTATVTVGEITVTIEVKNLLGGVKYLGGTRNGEILIQVTEVLPGAKIQIDETVHKFDANGKWIGVARVPVNERYVAIEHATAVEPSTGAVFTLIPHKTSLELRELSFSNQQLAPLAVEAAPVEFSRKRPRECQMTRADMTERANEIVNLQVDFSSGNVTGVLNGRRCGGRQVPRYIKGAGRYTGVPYDWGGFDGIDGFLEAMQQGRAAGDVETVGVETCSYGLDCSGFVSQVWRQPKKYGTFTLHEISDAIDVKSMQTGDVFNYSGSHVILFEKFTNNGIQGWESTKYVGVDRTIYMESTWARVNGYVPRKYNGVCQ